MEFSKLEGEQRLPKAVIITDHETAGGFSMGGAEIYAFGNAEMARAKLYRLLKNEEVKVLFVNEDFLTGVDSWVVEIIESPLPPFVVAIPGYKNGSVRAKRDSIKKVIRRETSRIGRKGQG